MNQKSRTILLSILPFYLVALPLIFTNYNVGRAYFDENAFHWPTIQFFIQAFDFTDYPSATTPGYHVILAACANIFSDNIIFLKLVSSFFTAGLVGLFAALLYDRAGQGKTLILLFPMIFSLYILPDGVWLVPDNLAWLTVGLMFALAVTCSATWSYFLWSGVVLLVAVAVRQSNLWLAALPGAMALSSLCYEKLTGNEKIKHILAAVLVATPAILLLTYFYQLWDGLVPPRMQGRHQHFSYSAPAFFLTLFFVYSFFYLPLIWTACKKMLSITTFIIIGAGFATGCLLALFPATDYNYDAGRFSGFWNFVRLAPVMGNTSILLLCTSSIGGALLAGWLLLLKREIRLVLLLTIIGYVLSLVCNAVLYERYFSGFLFILIFSILYKTDEIDWDELPAWSMVGPLLFTCVNALYLFLGHLPK